MLVAAGTEEHMTGFLLPRDFSRKGRPLSFQTVRTNTSHQVASPAFPEPDLLSLLSRCMISLGYSRQGTSKGQLFFPTAQQRDINVTPFSSGQGKGRGDKWAKVSIEVKINKVFFPRCVQRKPMQEKQSVNPSDPRPV